MILKLTLIKYREKEQINIYSRYQNKKIAKSVKVQKKKGIAIIKHQSF